MVDGEQSPKTIQKRKAVKTSQIKQYDSDFYD